MSASPRTCGRRRLPPELSGGFSDVRASIMGNSGSTIVVTGGATSTFYNPIALNSGSEFHVSANSTVVFFGDVIGFGTGTFSGSGTKIFEAGTSNVGPIVTSGATVVESSADLTAAQVREPSLTVNGHARVTADGGTSRVTVLCMGQAGIFDLSNNKLIVSAGSVGSWNGTGYTDISGLVDSGRGNAGNALWDGSGIVTSDTRAINIGELCSLGVAGRGAGRQDHVRRAAGYARRRAGDVHLGRRREPRRQDQHR